MSTTPEEKLPQEEIPAAETADGADKKAKKAKGKHQLTDEQMQKLEEVARENDQLKEQVSATEDRYLRLVAEYDNFRKRSQKEKEHIYSDAKADAVKAFLPVFDNLERALKQETADEAYAKGIQMTMTQLRSTMEQLGVTEIEALNQPFDPEVHSAVMHVEDEAFGENTVCEVFQAGFRLGEKVIRFAMVKVAN